MNPGEAMTMTLVETRVEPHWSVDDPTVDGTMMSLDVAEYKGNEVILVHVNSFARMIAEMGDLRRKVAVLTDERASHPRETMTLTFVEERRVPHLAANGVDTNTLMMDVLIAEQWGREVVLVDPDILTTVMEELGELRRKVAKLSRESVSRDVDNETGNEIDLDRRYTHHEHLQTPPRGYRFSYRDDDPGHPASVPYWVLVPNVS